MQRLLRLGVFLLVSGGCSAESTSPAEGGGGEGGGGVGDEGGDEGGNEGGDGEGGGGGGDGGGVADGEDYVFGEFVFTDGSTEELRSAVTVEVLELEEATIFVCSSTSGGERAAMLTVNWTADATPVLDEPFEQDLEELYVAAGFRLASGGVRAGGGVDGTVTLESFGTESGDVVAGTATETRDPDPDDPEDTLSHVNAIEFRCTIP